MSISVEQLRAMGRIDDPETRDLLHRLAAVRASHRLSLIGGCSHNPEEVRLLREVELLARPAHQKGGQDVVQRR
jgi:hypothetical protein